MTVDELRAELDRLSAQGYGSARVRLRASMGNRSTIHCGARGVSQEEHVSGGSAVPQVLIWGHTA